MYKIYIYIYIYINININKNININIYIYLFIKIIIEKRMRLSGIEPDLDAWKASVLPLYYRRFSLNITYSYGL